MLSNAANKRLLAHGFCCCCCYPRGCRLFPGRFRVDNIRGDPAPQCAIRPRTLAHGSPKHSGDVFHDEDIKRDLLKNIVDSFLDNGSGDMVRTVITAAPHPHYQKLASVVQSSLASPHLPVPGGVGQHVAAHAISHAHLLMPAVAIANLDIAGSLPLWGVVPGIAAAAFANKITTIGRKDDSNATTPGFATRKLTRWAARKTVARVKRMTPGKN